VTPIDTDRLLLRCFVPEDAADLFALMNDPDWLRYIGDRGVHSIDAARERIENVFVPNLRDRGFGFYAMVEKSSGNMVGMCGLIRRDGLDGIDLGYALLPTARGRGYVVEAGKAMLDHAHSVLGLTRVLAIVHPENRASIAVLERLGMPNVGSVRLPGETIDLALHAFDARNNC